MDGNSSFKGRVPPWPLSGLYKELVGWGRMFSLWPVHLVTGCCSPEFMQAAGPRYDMERFGTLPLPSVRQADVLMIFGLLTKKMATRAKMLWEQMPEPKYLMAIGICPIDKGPFYDSYSVATADEVAPVDVYVPGCPPRPEAILQGLVLLQEKVRGRVPRGAR